jgi:hypothetical protein
VSSPLLLLWLLAASPLLGGERIWLGADGRPLPLATDEEAVEFLRTAEIVGEEELDSGINRATKVLLQKDGHQVHAIFREAQVRAKNAVVGSRVYPEFVDNYLFECAAYELDRLLGLGRVPPATIRRIGSRTGSIQLWLEDSIGGLEEGGSEFRPPNGVAWANGLWDMSFFDNLVFNTDRNLGNLLVDSDHRLWLIDHTRAFQAVNDLLEVRFIRVKRETWDRLLALTEEELEARLAGYLEPEQIAALWSRRQRLVERVRKLALERGEHVVFY